MWLLLSLLKKSLNLRETAAEWIWNGCNEESKIFIAACKESAIWLVLGILMAWLIPHLFVKSLASVVVTLTTWWTILVTGLLCEWMCAIEVATLFLILVRVIRSISNGIVKNAHVIFDVASSGMEEESVWIRIYKSLSWRKFFIEEGKCGEEFVTLVFHVD